MKLTIKTVDRNWMALGERGHKAISFSISEKPKNEIYLTEDSSYDRSFNFHMIEGKELNNEELLFLVKAVISFLQPGYYLTSCGESWEQKERLRDFFEEQEELEDTDCLRILKDKSGQIHYYKILKKK